MGSRGVLRVFSLRPLREWVDACMRRCVHAFPASPCLSTDAPLFSFTFFSFSINRVILFVIFVPFVANGFSGGAARGALRLGGESVEFLCAEVRGLAVYAWDSFNPCLSPSGARQ